MRFISRFALVCILALACSAVAQSFSDKVDAYIEREMKAQHIPGLALGVYHEGKIMKAQGYGLANVELQVPVTPETVFQSGSVGKQFTAAAVMMLVEEGKVSLDDRIPKYFPHAPPGWQNIKVRNLLSHTSGLAEYLSDKTTGGERPINLREDYTEDQLVKFIESLPLDFQPGDKWSYCNSNYLLLGALIRKTTGKFYGDFLKERIFQPLGMTSTRIISEEDIVPNRSAGYRLVNGKLKNQEWVSPTLNTTADGALYFDILDLAKWDGALYTEKLLKTSSLNQMWTPAELNDGQPNSENYGFAWWIDHRNGHKIIEHGGVWQGFVSCIARYVDDKLTVAVLTNLEGDSESPEKIAHHVAEIYLGPQ